MCCFYNPCNFKSRIDNFVKFYNSIKHQIDRVEVVELIYNNIKSEKLPSYINSHKVYSDSVLWHKENLLNIGINNLILEGFGNIAWLDGDILFENSFWVEDTIKCLEKNNICQIFSIAEKVHRNHSTFHPSAVRSWKETGNILPTSQPYHTGHAWAAKASILSRCSLYDKSITGGADSLIWLSCFASKYNFSEIINSHPIFQLTCKKYYLDFLKWSTDWSNLIQGNVGYVFCNIKSLYHGSVKDKQYISRYSILNEANFDPDNDLFYNKHSVLESKSNTLSLKIKNYLNKRKEDSISLFEKIQNWLEKIETKYQNKNLEKNLENKI